MPKATLRDWFLLTRPWSVTAPLVPFLVGLGLVWSARAVEPGGWLRWSLGLLSGVLLVLACNLFNTWGDERSGVDRVPGAVLTTPQIQQGKITLRQTFVFGCVLFLLAAAAGLPTLFFHGPDGWVLNRPLLAGALVGFAGAINYSTGIKFKYLGLGVPYVAFLEGTLYVFVVIALLRPLFVTLELARLRFWRLLYAPTSPLWKVSVFLLLSLPVASLVGVILHGNDMRDIATDRKAGIRSLAASLGPFGALALFATLHLVPYLVPAVLMALVWRYGGGVWDCLPLGLPFLALPLTVRMLVRAVRDYRANPAAPAWLDLEKGSGGIHFAFGVLYALSFALS